MIMKSFINLNQFLNKIIIKIFYIQIQYKKLKKYINKTILITFL